MLCDLRDDRLSEIGKLYSQAATTKRYDDLLVGDLDAVAIATPVALHYPLAKAALMAGKHVLVEKPITARADQARELTSLAKERGLTLMVGHTFVYNPAVETVRQIVQSGELGRVYYLNCTRVNLGLLQPDINVMWDLAPHDLSILNFVLGMEPVSVSAHGAAYVNTSCNLPEVVYLILYFRDGLMANLRLSWLDPVKQRRLTVVGSRKMLVYDDLSDDKVVVFDHGVDVPPYSVTEEEFAASYRHGAETSIPIQWIEPLRAQCLHFIECIRSGAVPRSSGHDGLKIVQVLEAAQRSLVNGGVELKVEY
jgi:predicted dehydrogenase